MQRSQMTPRPWQAPYVFATNAHRYVVLPQACCRRIPSLRANFAPFAQTSVTGVRPSAKNTHMSKPCGNPPRRPGVVPRRVVRSTNPVRSERLHKTSENRPSHAASVLDGCLLSRDPLEGTTPCLVYERYWLRASWENCTISLENSRSRVQSRATRSFFSIRGNLDR